MSSIIRKKLFSQNAGTGGGSSTPTTQIIRYNVLNYSALAALTPNTGEFAYVKEEQGTKWLPGTIGGTYYASGLYYYTGTTWINDLTSIAAQLALNDTAILALQTGKFDNPTGTILQYIRGDGTLAILPTSIETVSHTVKYGEAITKGQAVYVSSADGTNMIVSKASNVSEATSSKTMGLVVATGSTNYQGIVVTEGLLDGLDTTGATAAGDPVWLGTNGNLIYGLVNKPAAPAHLVFIGIVTRRNVSNGEIFVKVQNGFELEELHNVSITGLTNNNLLTYESATSLWKNKTLGSVIGGLTSQYVRGDGSIATFPTTSGGGSSVAYYLNGGTSQGTIGGSTYYEMNKTATIGSGVDFTLTNTTGYIAQFITDVADPSLLSIPQGAWNFMFYFSASIVNTVGSFYVELYKYDGATFTLIASSSAAPELITNGTVIDLYTTSLAVPLTTLTVTDRLAVRVFVNTNGNKTITLHTQDSHLCEIITTFSTGLNSLNSLSAQVQYFGTGTSGTDFTINSTTDTHTFNLPIASATNSGKLSSTNWSTFNSKVGGSGTTNYVSRFTATGTIGNSLIQDNGTTLSIGAAPSAGYKLFMNAIGTNVGISVNADNVGIYGIADNTDSVTTPIGVVGLGTYGGEGIAPTISIGGQFTASNCATNYSLQLIDGSEGVNKYLKCVTADGKAQWATVDTSDFIPAPPITNYPQGYYANNGSATLSILGNVSAAALSGTASLNSIAGTNTLTRTVRITIPTSSTVGAKASVRTAALRHSVGQGFLFSVCWMIQDAAYVAGAKQFHGLLPISTLSTLSNTVDNSSIINFIGVGSDAADTNLQVFYNDATGTASKIDLGVNFPANRTAGAVLNNVYVFDMYNAPNTTTVRYRITERSTGNTAQGTISTDLPTADILLGAQSIRTNGATALATITQWSFLVGYII